jgi:diacylglycerol kinase (ATP)
MSVVEPWVAIQRNPTSGTGGARRDLLELVKHLRRLKLRPKLFTRRERLAAALADPNRRAALKCIVAAGGDGTFGDIINRYPGVLVALFPLGTENLVSRYLKIPKNGRRVAELIAAGKVATLDLGRCGDRRFAVMASAGFDADVIHRAHARRSGHISRLSYLQPIATSLRIYDYPELRVFVDDALTHTGCRLGVLVNLPAYALGITMATTARDNDGVFDLRLFQRSGAFQMWRYFLNLMRGTHERLADVKSMTATKVRWESDVPIPIQVDGDPAGLTPAEFEILPGAVQVVVP